MKPNWEFAFVQKLPPHRFRINNFNSEHSPFQPARDRAVNPPTGSNRPTALKESFRKIAPQLKNQAGRRLKEKDRRQSNRLCCRPLLFAFLFLGASDTCNLWSRRADNDWCGKEHHDVIAFREHRLMEQKAGPRLATQGVRLSPGGLETLS